MSSATRLKEEPAPAEASTVAPRATATLGDKFATRRWFSAAGLLALDVAVFYSAHRVLVWANLNDYLVDAQFTLFWLPLALLVPVLYIIGGYDVRRQMKSFGYTSEHLIAVVVATSLAALAIYSIAAYNTLVKPSRAVLLGEFGLFLPISLAYRWRIAPWVAARAARKSFLVLGAGAAATAFYEAYLKKPNRQQLVFVDPHERRVGEALAGEGSPTIEGGAIEKLLTLGDAYDGVIVAEEAEKLGPEVRDTLVRMHFLDVPVYTLETFYETHWRMIPVFALNSLWPLQMGFQFTRDYPYLHLKRLCDLAISSIGLVLLLPLILIVAILVRWRMGRPVIFRQSRIGRDRVPFTVFKFRTMHAHAEQGSPYTLERDTRITGLGQWLRRFRLDELPQLWNVFRGDMSLIGPRAESADCVAEYEARVASYHLRHLVKPGITGWAQVSYPYGAGYDDAVEKLKYDLYYIRHHSFLLDAMIVLKTLYVLLSARGR